MRLFESATESPRQASLNNYITLCLNVKQLSPLYTVTLTSGVYILNTCAVLMSKKINYTMDNGSFGTSLMSIGELERLSGSSWRYLFFLAS